VQRHDDGRGRDYQEVAAIRLQVVAVGPGFVSTNQVLVHVHDSARITYSSSIMVKGSPGPRTCGFLKS
jgi:hypothetical protein